MKVVLYNFNKRSNSTKRPNSDGAEVNVTLKDDTSIYTPSFTLAIDPTGYNYLLWGNRYYYINDIVYVARNVWNIDCSIDVLATYKNNILASSAFVLYSASNYNVNIVDTRLSANANVSYNSNSVYPFGSAPLGYFCVGYVGSDNTIPVAPVSFYGLSALVSCVQSKSFADFLSVDHNDKLLNGAYNAIRSCKYIRADGICSTSGGGTIHLGADYDTGVAKGTMSIIRSGSFTLNIPWLYNDFRNSSRFTSLLLQLTGYGVIELNPDDFYGQKSITVNYCISTMTGEVSYNVANGKAICNGSLGCDVPIGVIAGSNGVSVASGIIGGAISALTGNVIGGVAQGFNAITSNMGRSVGSVGSTSSNTTAGVSYACTLTVIAHSTNVSPDNITNNYGRPLNAVVNLGSLSGYVQTCNASVSINSSAEIADQVNNLLNGGVFIE